MYLLTWILAFVIVAIVVFIAVFFGWVAIQTRARRRSEPGFEYIYVANDGSARELDVDEQEYLRTKFQPADGARPYIKFKYESLTPENSEATLSGDNFQKIFLFRNRQNLNLNW